MCRVRRSATRGRLAGASVGAHGRRRPPPPQPAECETATDHAVDRPNATVTRPEALLRIAPSAQAGARPCSTRLEPAYIHAATALCCTLTPRSSRVPTPGHQACGPEWLIIRPAGLVPRRRDRLTSNVRQQQMQSSCSSIRRAMGPAARFGHSGGQTVWHHHFYVPRQKNAETAVRRHRRTRDSTSVHGHAPSNASTLLPNPSFKPSPNGKTLGPRRYAVHHQRRGPSVSPLGPAYLER